MSKKDKNSAQEDKLKALESKVEELELALKEKDNEYLFKLAELDNIRKRMEKDKAQFVEFANEKIILSFLDILDNLERALNSEGDIRSGVEMIYAQFLDTLSKEGVESIEVKSFDPEFHHAISMDKGEEELVEEIRRGYKLKDRVIRPTLVRLINKED